MSATDNKEAANKLNAGDVKRFLAEIEVLYKKYNLSISHEDWQGAFLIEEFNQRNIDWLNDANYGKWNTM